MGSALILFEQHVSELRSVRDASFRQEIELIMVTPSPLRVVKEIGVE